MNRRSFLTALAGLPLLPSALAAAPVSFGNRFIGAGVYERIPFWATVAPSSRPLTFAMMQECIDRIAAREQC